MFDPPTKSASAAYSILFCCQESLDCGCDQKHVGHSRAVEGVVVVVVVVVVVAVVVGDKEEGSVDHIGFLRVGCLCRRRMCYTDEGQRQADSCADEDNWFEGAG